LAPQIDIRCRELELYGACFVPLRPIESVSQQQLIASLDDVSL